nr:hypothetical protein [Pandoravirus massiliensis]
MLCILDNDPRQNQAMKQTNDGQPMDGSRFIPFRQRHTRSFFSAIMPRRLGSSSWCVSTVTSLLSLFLLPLQNNESHTSPGLSVNKLCGKKYIFFISWYAALSSTIRNVCCVPGFFSFSLVKQQEDDVTPKDKKRQMALGLDCFSHTTTGDVNLFCSCM